MDREGGLTEAAARATSATGTAPGFSSGDSSVHRCSTCSSRPVKSLMSEGSCIGPGSGAGEAGAASAGLVPALIAPRAITPGAAAPADGSAAPAASVPVAPQAAASGPVAGESGPEGAVPARPACTNGRARSRLMTRAPVEARIQPAFAYPAWRAPVGLARQAPASAFPFPFAPEETARPHRTAVAGTPAAFRGRDPRRAGQR